MKPGKLLPDTHEEVYLVPVPKGRLQDVYRVLAEPRASTAPAEPPAPPDAHGEPGASAFAQAAPRGDFAAGTPQAIIARWTPGKLSELHDRVGRYPAAEAAIELTAAQPEEPVSIRQVEAETNLSSDQVRAEMGALTKLVKKILGGHNEWPFRAAWGAGGEDCMYYVMPTEVAERWKKLG